MKNKILWFRRWREESYKDLFRAIYGDERYEHDKGLKREYSFLSQICGMWSFEVKRLSPLLREAQDLLRENGLETQSMKANREVLEKFGVK